MPAALPKVATAYARFIPAPESLRSNPKGLLDLALAAAAAADFQVLKTDVWRGKGETRAVVVVGESHILLRVRDQPLELFAQVVSCTGRSSATQVIRSIRDVCPGSEEIVRVVEFDGRKFAEPSSS